MLPCVGCVSSEVSKLPSLTLPWAGVQFMFVACMADTGVEKFLTIRLLFVGCYIGEQLTHLIINMLGVLCTETVDEC